MTKIKLAAKCYDDMLENYRNIIDDPADIESADRFLDAAMELCWLQQKNPFYDLAADYQMNAAKTPVDGRIVTGVMEIGSELNG